MRVPDINPDVKPKYCLVQRELELTANEEVIAVRNIWEVIVPAEISLFDRACLLKKASQMNSANKDPETDFVVCPGPFSEVLAVQKAKPSVIDGEHSKSPDL
jgi:hypothetical protein